MPRRPESLGPCIIISQKPDKAGYGRVTVLRFGKIIRRAHVLAWVDANGRLPNPETPFICHHCDNPSCINPDHLYEGSPQDNAADMVERRRYWNMRATHCIHGHEFTEENIFRQANGGRGCRECRRRRAREWQRAQVVAEGRTPQLHPRDRTHCPYGHPYDEGNTKIQTDGSRTCLTCRRARQREKREAAAAAEGRALQVWPKYRTHCVNGHPFDEENTQIQSDGRRACRECRRATYKAYRQRKRDKANGGRVDVA